MHVELAAFIAGERLDIKTASEREPKALRAEFVKGLSFISLSDSDIDLIILIHKFRASLKSARKKTPDYLSSAVAGCREGKLDETTWETRIYRHAATHITNAIRTALRDVPMDGDSASDTKREAGVLRHGGPQAVTAFGIVEDLVKAGDIGRAEAQMSEYGGTQALAACAVAATDDPKVTSLLETLSDASMKSLAAFIGFSSFHVDVARFVDAIFRAKAQSHTRRNRIGRAPRKAIMDKQQRSGQLGRKLARGNRENARKSFHVADSQPSQSVASPSRVDPDKYGQSPTGAPMPKHVVAAIRPGESCSTPLSSPDDPVMVPNTGEQVQEGYQQADASLAEAFQPIPNEELLDYDLGQLPMYDRLPDDNNISQLLVRDFYFSPDQS
ncbi:hypothetical protein NKR23_g12087 [Pleurostoma richardsiae]|uniref:Uncharacterized protein n=1 Tax=Pleurostoma richardsiae TaxID=41990 RepID=A0AA38R6L0_9PEZI|nr:hypothetical protein NKR23_g12087 [Pleurostoma richardsiae]